LPVGVGFARLEQKVNQTKISASEQKEDRNGMSAS
jgi:hypothetical protein